MITRQVGSQTPFHRWVAIRPAVSGVVPTANRSMWLASRQTTPTLPPWLAVCDSANQDDQPVEASQYALLTVLSEPTTNRSIWLLNRATADTADPGEATALDTWNQLVAQPVLEFQYVLMIRLSDPVVNRSRWS